MEENMHVNYLLFIWNSKVPELKKKKLVECGFEILILDMSL